MLGLQAGERTVKPEALRNFAGLFITQSVFGIVPVVKFDGVPVPPSPLVRQIERSYHKMLIHP
jgi:branched-subunit amino acid aminotransferase/4-amino-4-deoxychorismate lyase